MIQKNKCHKIAIVLPNLKIGGTEKMRVLLANYWLSKGYDIEFVLINGQDSVLNDQLSPQIKVIDLACGRFYKSVLPLTMYIRNSDASVMLSAMWPLTIISILAKIFSLSRIPLVFSEHSILSKSFAHKNKIHKFLMRLSMRLLYPLAQGRIGVSNGVVKEIAQMSNMPLSKFQVIYNPAYVDNEDSVKQNLTDDSKIIITAGSFKEVKNHQLLIKAFSQYLEKYKIKTKLYILGDGILRNKYELLIDSLSLNDCVVLPGFVRNPISYFKSSDLFVLSSNHEGLGNVIIEALGCGLPVVSTDCESGPSEILADGKFGSLVPINDIEKLSEAIFNGIVSEQDSHKLKLRAKDFSVQKIGEEYIKVLFDDVIKNEA
jgi:glycosyltransferase involved in cell wall biosynthesis